MPTSAASRLLSPSSGQKTVGVGDEGDGDRRVTRPDGDPVAPRRLEADEVAERAARVGVRAAGARQRAAEVGEHEREQDRARAREHPGEDRDRAGGAGQRGGQQEHARADHVADDERRRHPQAHRALELRTCGWASAGGNGWCRSGGHVLLLGSWAGTCRCQTHRSSAGRGPQSSGDTTGDRRGRLRFSLIPPRSHGDLNDCSNRRRYRGRRARGSWTRTGVPPTTFRSGRSICSTTRCCASRSGGARQAAAARSLGYDAGAQPRLCASEPAIRQRDIDCSM